MGIANSKEILYKHELLEMLDDEIFGKITLYKSKQNKYVLKCSKVYDKYALSELENLKDNDFKFLKQRISNLPLEVFACCLTSFDTNYNQETGLNNANGTITYDVGAWSLADIIRENGPLFPQELGFTLFYLIAYVGAQFQESLNFFPQVKNEEIFVTGTGLKFLNPFIHDSYFRENLNVSSLLIKFKKGIRTYSEDIPEQYLDRILSSFDERESLITKKNMGGLKEIHEINLDRIRQNVKETALTVLGFVSGVSENLFYDEKINAMNISKIKECLEVRNNIKTFLFRKLKLKISKI